ncbi:hypothetical protein L6164_000835 [Bauhinia variegata]|uniref:Uncharacterized protein n=1 Tax=Bauhinia variegata TaxID=167791 RepID=A0ACB9Q7R5_BAUVA|nr:hypothetical protein L6164_000835 [Bauhinia variegata]
MNRQSIYYQRGFAPPPFSCAFVTGVDEPLLLLPPEPVMVLPINFPALLNPLPTAPRPLPTSPTPLPTRPAPAPMPLPTSPAPATTPLPTKPAPATTPPPTKPTPEPTASIVLPIIPASFSFFLSSSIFFSASRAASCSSLLN